MNTPLFEKNVLSTMERCTSIFTGRGKEYGDTWKDAQLLKLKSVFKELFNFTPDDEQLRIVACASLCDLKYWRFLGGYKDDNLIDGINYDAFLAEAMRKQKEKK